MSEQARPSGKSWQNSIEWKLLLTLVAVAVLPFSLLSAFAGSAVLQTTGGMVAVIVQVIALGFAWHVLSGIIRQTTAINEALNRINAGDFEARVEVVTKDELGHSATALNAMCDNTLNLMLSNDQQIEVQASIENLIGEMTCIAAGDLTISTEVNDDITAGIADSFNHMTEQLRSIVQQVQVATEQVTDSAAEIRDSSTELSTENDHQAKRIRQASDKLLEMTSAFENVASLTKESVNVAVEARQTAGDGLKAVNDTVEGMQRIRTQVQNTSKRIKRLGESSQEIGEIVQMISDIADRTSILALNASIQAAAAGDAGHGFAVVAEEVERLAERSADATGQIAKLIRGIQSETSEVVSDMEESTREVVAGSQLATQAGETLFEIDSVSNQLVELIESASASASTQADAANKIAADMTKISCSTKESAEKSRTATESVGQLAQMSNVLRESVSRFKVNSSDEGDPALSDEPQAGIDNDQYIKDQLEEVSNIFAEQGESDKQAAQKSKSSADVCKTIGPGAPISPTIQFNDM